jgi:hypothetical protein
LSEHRGTAEQQEKRESWKTHCHLFKMEISVKWVVRNHYFIRKAYMFLTDFRRP